MAIDRRDVEKIIAGVVGVGVVGLGIAALIETVIDGGEPFVPDYDGANGGNSPEPDDDVDDDEYYGYSNVPAEDEIFEEDRIQREMNSMWDDYQADQMREDYRNENFQQRDGSRAFESVQSEFEQKNSSSQTEYIYLDFTHNLKSGSRNWNDVYQDSIEDQFERVRRKLALHGKNDVTDLKKFVSLCFPMVKSTYYVSLPSFERQIETARQGIVI